MFDTIECEIVWSDINKWRPPEILIFFLFSHPKTFQFLKKNDLSACGNLPRSEKGEGRRKRRERERKLFLCEGGKAMSWRRVAKSLQALTAHSFLLSFTLLLVLKLHHTISYSWWSVLFSFSMYVFTCVYIRFFFFFFWWVCIFLIILGM